MSEPPLVSIVVPAFNAADSLAATLDSAMRQSFSRFELLVVDDGSRDATAEVALRYAERDTRVRLIRQSNQGVVAARNRGIRESRGALIAPLDADDIWFENKLSRQIELIESSGPRVGLVYCWLVHLDGDDRLTGHWCSGEATGEVLVPLVMRNFLGNASTPLIRRSCLEKVGLYDESLRLESAEATADWDLYLRLASISEFRVVPEFLVGYRLHAKNMTSEIGSMFRAYGVVMERTRRRHPDLPEKLFQWSEADFLFYIASVSTNYSGKLQDGFSWLRRALRRDPSFALQPRFYRLGIAMILEWLGISLRRNSPRFDSLRGEVDLQRLYRTIARKRRFSLDPFNRRLSRYS